MNTKNPIKVAVSGACGRMGRQVCRAVLEDRELELTAAFDEQERGSELGRVLEGPELGMKVAGLSAETLKEAAPDVMVDFTTPVAVIANIETALQCGVRPVVGTTGITQADLSRLREQVEKAGLGAVIAPNFALGAVLMMKFAQQAARYLPQAEIIEMHHDNKMDAPSGTALKTAEMISAARSEVPAEKEELLKVQGARGGSYEGVHLHSVRLQGLIAHQQVIFGGLGQTLTIRHDSYDRSSFMPGVVMAAKKVMDLEGLVYGLENLLD